MIAILNNIYDESYLKPIMFTDKATFHVNDGVNQHHSKIQEYQQQREICTYYVKDSSKVIIWSVDFTECSIIRAVYLETLYAHLFPQI